MARPEQIEKLDRQVAAAVARAVDDFREEVGRRLRAANTEIARALEQTKPALPATFLTAQDFEAIETETRSEARALGSGELLAAARELDAAGTQAGVLAALLEAAGGFSARAAVFLTRGDEVRGWRGRGFGEASSLEKLLFDLGETPWTDLASGTGCVPLSPGDCARITSRLEVPLAQGGTLIPLVLRDQVAATLYADRGQGSPWNPEALQILSYLAALALETLPFRSRTQTPTLLELGKGGGLPMWSGLPDATDDTAPALSIPSVDEPALSIPSVDEPELAELEVAEPERGDVDVTASLPTTTALEAPAAEPEFSRSRPAVEPVSPWAEPLAETETTTAAAQYTIQEPAASEVDETPPSIFRTAVPLAPTPAPEEATDAYWLEEDAPAESAATAQPFDQETPWAAAPPALEPPPPPALAPTLVPPPAAPVLPMAPSVPLPRTDAPLATVAIAAPTLDDDATLMLQRPRQPEVPAPVQPYGVPDDPTHPGIGGRRPSPSTSPIPIPPPRTWQPGETAEVAPPSDLQGPGWAFATSRLPTMQQPASPASEDASVNEEARRLARLLVSEIKLYNEERVEDGRRNRDIYERLKEDIDRSRQMYEERVDSRAMKGTDYFYQELVRILAAGDAKALGI